MSHRAGVAVAILTRWDRRESGLPTRGMNTHAQDWSTRSRRAGTAIPAMRRIFEWVGIPSRSDFREIVRAGMDRMEKI
jgi:hypothetical protein